jgi:transposase
LTPLDSPSFHVDGRYNSEDGPDEHVIHITRGDSRDHRPDLTQVMLALIGEHQAGIPVLLKPLSGNSSAVQDCGAVIRTHIDQLHTTYGATYLGADSALYSADNLQKLAGTSMKGISRVPATVREAQAVFAQAAPQTMVPLLAGSHCPTLPSTYGGGEQRWVLVDSEPRRAAAQRTVDKQWRKQSTKESHAFKKRCRTPFAWAAEAQQALTACTQELEATALHWSTIDSRARDVKRGRPGQDTAPKQVSYAMQGALGTVIKGYPVIR